MGRLISLRRERRLLAPPSEHSWWRSHAQGPTVLALRESLWRIYFAARDAANKSHIVYADFNPLRGLELFRLHSEPVLDLGPPGSFDSAGMLPSSALLLGGRIFLYYIGYSLRRDVPHQLAIGLAVSDDGGTTFRRVVPGPVLAIGPFDPYFTSTPHVARIGNKFRMHYASGVAWSEHGERPDYRCHIKSAYSTDGITWTTEERVVLGGADEAEAAVARPWIISRSDGHHMWFCCRGERNRNGAPYRIGYARSDDGLAWRRRDDLLRFENPAQPSDWDAEMQAYPCLVPRDDELLIFYNGNGYGQSGFGFGRITTGPQPPL